MVLFGTQKSNPSHNNLSLGDFNTNAQRFAGEYSNLDFSPTQSGLLKSMFKILPKIIKLEKSISKYLLPEISRRSLYIGALRNSLYTGPSQSSLYMALQNPSSQRVSSLHL